MEGFTYIDAIVAVVIILSAILAYARGFVREALSIAGWIGAAVIAFVFAAAARPMVAQIPGLDKFLGDNCELSTIASFAAVFALALVLFSIITPLFASVVSNSAIGGVDQGLGFLFGVARGVLLVLVAFAVYERVIGENGLPPVENSRSAQIFAGLTGSVNDQIPEDAPGWIASRYEELVASCAKPGGAAVAPQAPAANPAPATGN